MQAVRLFLSDGEQQGQTEVERLTLQRGYGITGDRHALPGSPRQILLVSTSSLNRLALEPGQLQENVLVDGAIDSLMSGQTLQLGEEALVRLTFRCEPCAALNKVQPGLAHQIRGQRGMLGLVVRGGTVRRDDRLTLTPHAFPALPETARGRFEEFVARIPRGRVVRTADLLLALGLTSSYYRVMPTFIKKAPASLPVHRIVGLNGNLLTHHLPHQRELLEAEGVSVEGDRVPQSHSWPRLNFHDLGGL